MIRGHSIASQVGDVGEASDRLYPRTKDEIRSTIREIERREGRGDVGSQRQRAACTGTGPEG